MSRTIITIPTYWGWPTGTAGQPADGVFDHPTPLDTEGTLGRTLDSLRSLNTDAFEVLLITAVVNSKLSDAVHEKIEALISPYRSSFPVAQFGRSDLLVVSKAMEEQEIDPLVLSLNAYPDIRNCQLVGSMLLDADLIAAIDDDEVVPEDYLSHAGEFAGTIWQQERVDGVAGIYLDANGGYRVKETEAARKATNLFRRKFPLMNDEFSGYMEHPDRIVRSTIALGGNMVFTEQLFMNVPFDPGITRGEDIDYLINSQMLGYNWFFDRELSITHLPPEPTDTQEAEMVAYSKLQQDVIRFMYQRAKLEYSREAPGVTAVTADDCGVYPGSYLEPDLETHALAALSELRPPGTDERFYPESEQLMAIATKRTRAAPGYFSFVETWRSVMRALRDDKKLKQYMRRKMG